MRVLSVSAAPPPSPSVSTLHGAGAGGKAKQPAQPPGRGDAAGAGKVRRCACARKSVLPDCNHWAVGSAVRPHPTLPLSPVCTPRLSPTPSVPGTHVYPVPLSPVCTPRLSPTPSVPGECTVPSSPPGWARVPRGHGDEPPNAVADARVERTPEPPAPSLSRSMFEI